MARGESDNTVTINRRARYDYVLGDELTMGMSLSGDEVRSIRDHHVQLKGSFVTIRNSELWLNNLTLGTSTARNIKLLVTMDTDGRLLAWLMMKTQIHSS